MEATARDGDDADIDEYPDELYEMYGSPPPGQRYGQNRYTDRRGSSRRRERSQSRRRPQYISEEEEDDDDFGPSNTDSLSDFEMLNSARPVPSRTQSRSRPSMSRGQSRRAPELKNVRVKVHNGDDTRYVMVGSAAVFEDFVDRVREKFGVRTRFKLKVRDEGDFITLGDGDDWDMCLGTVRKDAMREGADLGKLEVSLFWFFYTFPPVSTLRPPIPTSSVRAAWLTLSTTGLDPRSMNPRFTISTVCRALWLGYSILLLAMGRLRINIATSSTAYKHLHHLSLLGC